MPYKQKIVPYLDTLINDAETTSSVNTLYINNELHRQYIVRLLMTTFIMNFGLVNTTYADENNNDLKVNHIIKRVKRPLSKSQ